MVYFLMGSDCLKMMVLLSTVLAPLMKTKIRVLCRGCWISVTMQELSIVWRRWNVRLDGSKRGLKGVLDLSLRLVGVVGCS